MWQPITTMDCAELFDSEFVRKKWGSITQALACLCHCLSVFVLSYRAPRGSEGSPRNLSRDPMKIGSMLFWYSSLPPNSELNSSVQCIVVIGCYTYFNRPHLPNAQGVSSLEPWTVRRLTQIDLQFKGSLNMLGGYLLPEPGMA